MVLKIQKEGMMVNVEKYNLISILNDEFKKNSLKQALFTKIKNQYQGISYSNLLHKIIQFSHALKKLDVKEQDKIAILLKNCPEWVISDLASISIKAIVVPIYETLSTDEKSYILNHSEAKVLVTDSSHENEIDQLQANCPKLKHIISADHINKCLNFKRLLDTTYKNFPNNIENIEESQIVSIVYTSGTTGISKGVCLTHKNIVSNVKSITSRLPLSNNERVLSFLPLSHVFERTAGYYTLLVLGGQIFYAENIDSVGANIIESHPTIVISVPRLYEKIQDKILKDLKGLKKLIFNWALKVGENYQKTRKKNISYLIANRLVFSKIKKKTGGCLKFFVSGGAALSEEIARFFYALDILIIEGYGLTESSPVIACNHPDDFKFGTVGKALECSEIKISNENELLVRGPHIMKGYYKNTKQHVVDIDNDGFLHTGDLVEIDSDGFIRIIDRKKNIIVLSTGKNVSPQKIENALAKSEWVSQILCIGAGKSYLTALIVVNMKKTQEFALENNISYNKNILNNPLVLAEVQKNIEQYQTNLSNYEKIKKFKLLATEFTQEKGELTPTLKTKRKVIKDNYKLIIEEMYND